MILVLAGMAVVGYAVWNKVYDGGANTWRADFATIGAVWLYLAAVVILVDFGPLPEPPTWRLMQFLQTPWVTA